jgi:hypothetical protein
VADYEVGYGKPPKNTRFKSGRSGNPIGRPKRKPVPIAECINEILDAPIVYQERGRSHTTTRQELSLRILIARAATGDIGAAENLLKIRERAERYGDAGINILKIHDWLPDHPGQTADQKTRALVDSGEAVSAGWRPPDTEDV